MNDINLGISLVERGVGRRSGTGGKSSAKQHAGAVYENALPNSQRGRAEADLQAILITPHAKRRLPRARTHQRLRARPAEQSWLRIRGADKIAPLLQGIPFRNCIPVIDSTPVQQPLAG
jgi:hypothetical protein